MIVRVQNPPEAAPTGSHHRSQASLEAEKTIKDWGPVAGWILLGVLAFKFVRDELPSLETAISAKLTGNLQNPPVVGPGGGGLGLAGGIGNSQTSGLLGGSDFSSTSPTANQTTTTTASPTYSGSYVMAPYVGGGQVAVPSGVVQNSIASFSQIKGSGYQPAGGYQSQTYVAGRAPATAASPAGGGTYAGLNDTQTAALFQATYGSNWQSVWASQHAAEVSKNGG